MSLVIVGEIGMATSKAAIAKSEDRGDSWETPDLPALYAYSGTAAG